MLHDWKMNGVEKAQERYLKDIDLANRKQPKDITINFSDVVRGKLEHVRLIRSYRIEMLNRIEKEESIRSRVAHKRKELQTIHKDQYYKYFQRFEQLTIRDCGLPTVLGEGETDWMHLRKSFSYLKENGKYPALGLNIHKHKEYALGGVNYLKDFCKDAMQLYVEFSMPVICVFDCDIPDINAKHRMVEDGFIAHGNNIFSIVLPKPSHRSTDTYAIEQLYNDSDLLKKDSHNRRLYLSSEFSKKTGKLNSDSSVVFGKKARNGEEFSGWKSILNGNEKIIDSYVCVDSGGKLKNIALSKKDFANHILRNEPPFDKMDYSGFEAVFDLIQKICSLQLNTAQQPPVNLLVNRKPLIPV